MKQTMKKQTMVNDRYEIRRSGQVLCQSQIENCGYSTETLKAMKAAGLGLFMNGKRVKV